MPIRRTILERILAALAGAILGAIITVSLLFSGMEHWVVWLPVAAGAAAGCWKGDRALRRLMRLLPWVT